MLMDAITMVVTCCPFSVSSSCLSIRKRSMLHGRSWSVFVRVFTAMSNTLGLVDVFVVLFLAQALCDQDSILFISCATALYRSSLETTTQ